MYVDCRSGICHTGFGMEKPRLLEGRNKVFFCISVRNPIHQKVYRIPDIDPAYALWFVDLGCCIEGWGLGLSSCVVVI